MQVQARWPLLEPAAHTRNQCKVRCANIIDPRESMIGVLALRCNAVKRRRNLPRLQEILVAVQWLDDPLSSSIELSRETKRPNSSLSAKVHC